MDFQRISAKQKLTMNVPLHFIGEDVAPGIKQGGIASHLENSVEVSCLPADLPENLEVDISELNLDQSLHLSNIKLPKGVELVAMMHEEFNDLPIVSIHVPRAVVETEAAPEEAAAEGEEKPAEGSEEKPSE